MFKFRGDHYIKYTRIRVFTDPYSRIFDAVDVLCDADGNDMDFRKILHILKFKPCSFDKTF